MRQEDGNWRRVTFLLTPEPTSVILKLNEVKSRESGRTERPVLSAAAKEEENRAMLQGMGTLIGKWLDFL